MENQQRSRSQLPGAKLNNEEQQFGQTFNSTNRKTIHDMDAFLEKKKTESAPFFRTARVQTCSHVMVKNGKAIAVAFPLEKTGWKNPNSYANTKRSTEVESWNA